MSFKLNHFKGKAIGRDRIVWSLCDFVVGSRLLWVADYEKRIEYTIYHRVADERPYNPFDSYTYHTEHGVYELIGFADTLECAASKVNRIITGASVYIRHTNLCTCPNCNKTWYKNWWIEEYTWTRYRNSYPYHAIISDIHIEGDIEYIQCKPKRETIYCEDCKHLDDDLPF